MSFYWYSSTWGIHRSCTTTFSPREQRWTPVASSQPALSSVDGSAWMRCFATWVSAPGTRCRSLLELPWKSCRNRHWIYVRATAFLLLSKGKQHDFVSRHVANSPGFYFCLAVVSPFQFQTEQKQPGIAGTASARKELAFFFFVFCWLSTQKQTRNLETSPSLRQPPSVWFTARDDSVISLLYCCCCCCYFTWFGMWAFWHGVVCVGSCGWRSCLFSSFLSLVRACLSAVVGLLINYRRTC